MTKIYATGVDWAKFQGSQGVWGKTTDSFSIAQIGGINANGIYTQKTYDSQINATLNLKKHANTYIWYQVGNDLDKAKQVLDFFLPKIKSPKRSIVALDYEDGASGDKAGNTNAILYGMQRIKDAGYTPMYYSYKPYTLNNVNYKDIVDRFGVCLWIAAYLTKQVRSEPNFAGFPSMDGIAIWQWTSSYVVGVGKLDGNVDLTGITLRTPTISPTPTPTPTRNTIAVDGVWGQATTLALQRLYDMRYQDGKLSKPSALIKVLQKHLGVTQDGYLGPQTISAMQRKLGTPVDGKISSPSVMVKSMQNKINAGIKPF
ncbi:GH25 family lysozyme [Lactobacillus acetotolerans]|uniref:GH25 family lysozyme n=1 Tax=Lactobacillus acetotolerans TaxID=1600 RepID=UPI002FDB67E5